MLNKRADHRMTTSPIPALIIDQERMGCIEVTMHNFTWSGCCIVGKGIRDFSDTVAVHFDGLQQLLGARIIWREGSWAGVAFERAELQPDDRRAESRFEYTIPIVISDANFTRRIACTTLNASRSGCQIEANDVDQLTNDVFVKIQDFDWPIKGHIMWRHFNVAGVRLIWKPERLAQNPARAIIESKIKPEAENVFV